MLGDPTALRLLPLRLDRSQITSADSAEMIMIMLRQLPEADGRPLEMVRASTYGILQLSSG